MVEVFKDIIEIYGISLPAALLTAAACSFFGTYVVLKRIVFIGITISEVAACGIAAGLFFKINPMASALFLTFLFVTMVTFSSESKKLPQDAFLGISFVGASSLAILLVSKSGFGLDKVKNLVYGNLMFAGKGEVYVILATTMVCLAVFLYFYRPVIYSFIDSQTSRVMGINTGLYEYLFFICLGTTIAVSAKTAGVMLIFCYLVAGPSAGLLLFRSLWASALGGAVISVFYTIAGLYFSYIYDFPPNQTIALAGCLVFVASAGISFMRK